MTALRVAVFNIVFYAATFFWAMYIAIACRIVSPDRVRRMIRSWCLWVRGWVRVGLGARIEIQGRENIPDVPYVLAPKHQSELDVCMIFGEHSDAGAVVMKELADLPFLGKLIEKLDMVSVSVEHGPQGATQAIREGAKRVMAQGRPMLIYPEGELMALGAHARYKHGVFHIYEATGAPVLPVAQSLGAVWPKREWRKKPGHSCAIRYLEPIPPGLGEEEFMARLENAVETATMDLIRQHATGEELRLAEDRYARGVGNE
ncbi:MAG: lysophospholipid acyltransferase family protein [Pikeienuella sp.]